MKKVLSFVLVLAMLLGCFSMVFAASFTDVEDGDDHEDAINVLSSLGVVSGYTDNTFKPEKVVTRAEMAAFIINALFGQDKKITQRSTKFSDVTASHWASGFVDYANTLDIIAGYTDGTFKPDQVVTYNEAITMIVKALGYRDAALNGTYPASYVSKAQALGLLKDVDGLGTAGAARGDIAQLVYNALPCRIGAVNKDGEWVASTPADTMYIRLGVYDVEDPIIIYGDEDSEISLTDYLGQYAKVAVNVDGDIVAITSIESEAYTAKTNGDCTKIGDYKLSKIEGKTAAYFVNGEFTTEAAFKATGLTAKKTYTFNGAFSGNYVTKIYSVVEWTPAKTFMVTEDILDELEEDDTLNTYEFAKNNKDEIDEDEFTIVGVDSLADLKENYVVTVYLNSDDEVVRIEVGTEVVTAEMTKRVGTKVTFDGTKYDYADAASLKFEQDYDLFFDYAGELFAIEEAEEAEATEFYAVLLDVYDGSTTNKWATAGTTTDLQIKVLDADGKTNVYAIDEDITTAVKFDSKADLNKVVVYTLDEDGVVDTLEIVIALGSASKSVSSKGVVDGKYYFAEDALVFQCTDEGKYEWKVVKAEDLAKSDLEKAAYTVDTKGKVDLLIFSSAETTDKTYGFYIDQAETSKDKSEVYFWVDGEEVSFTTKTTGITISTNAFTLAEVEAKTSTLVASKADVYTIDVTVSTGASIKANTLIIDGNETGSYALDKDVIVYVYDESDKELSVSSLTKLEDVAKTYKVYLYDTDGDKLGKGADGTYEIVVFTQK